MNDYTDDYDYMDEDFDLVEIIRDESMHAVYFTYHGIVYVFSGWWILGWRKMGEPFSKSKCKDYDTKEEFLADPIFDGKTLAEIQDEVTEKSYYVDPIF